jgi:hypothetical protein
MTQQPRVCLECGDKITGRIDKKFCTDSCRNAYHNRTNSDPVEIVKSINAVLKKNRRILSELNPGGKSKVTRDELLRKGFSFTYFTNIFLTRNGKTYYFCYDQGYVELEPNFFALVHRQEYVS